MLVIFPCLFRPAFQRYRVLFRISRVTFTRIVELAKFNVESFISS